MQQLIEAIINNPIASLAVVGNLVLIESLLSIDNAAVLATMVMDLPQKDRNRALRYGIWGAYLFRGLAMLFTSILIQIWWLKPLGGLYLLYLVYDYWKAKSQPQAQVDKQASWLYRMLTRFVGTFWATVTLVELMDMAFSIDNVFAAVAFTPNIVLVCIGVFIGILAMRFVAQSFVQLLQKHPYLANAAYVVIALLGIKLTLSLYEHLYPHTKLTQVLTSHTTDVALSLVSISVFATPFIVKTIHSKI